ncbi:MAG: hypothetical protein IT406_03905 [Candidatus Yanofskybacteria bacterium]|nr:hypothetical protein [Candidatus Yanofskybacteria bacterium]
MSDLMLDVDQAGELKAAFRRGDWTNAEIKKLCEGDILKNFRDVLRGFSEIKPILHAIDCDVNPFVPDGWSYREEDQLPGRIRGTWTWDPSVKLYLSKKQGGDKYIVGNDLRKELKPQSVLPANVLDYLLAHPELIPEDWNGKAIFFWGTIYRNSRGNLYVRCLYWDGGGWDWDYGWLDYGFSGSNPAVVRAS